jgi:hypothetical protein
MMNLDRRKSFSWHDIQFQGHNITKTTSQTHKHQPTTSATETTTSHKPDLEITTDLQTKITTDLEITSQKPNQNNNKNKK